MPDEEHFYLFGNTNKQSSRYKIHKNFINTHYTAQRQKFDAQYPQKE